MYRSLDHVLRWMHEGTSLALDVVAAIGPDEWDGPSLLPGWSRKHLVAHLAGNAEALGNLVHWAASGQETPMYPSPEARNDGIAKGATLTGDELVEWASTSAGRLEAAMSTLGPEQWQRQVMTSRGRTILAIEIPWMRDREVYVHSVDLDTGLTFADLPEDFLQALQQDIIAGRGDVPELVGNLADVTAYLAGRPYERVTLTDGGPAPQLGPWL